jgi:cyclohexadienyl dehydratase
VRTQQLRRRTFRWLGAIATAALAAAAPAPSASAATLRVATSGDYPPFSAICADGQRRGLDIAVAERLAADLGLHLDWVRLVWPELDASTAGAAFDVAMSGITMRADRALLGRFTRPYAVTHALVLARKQAAARFATLAALNRPGVRIAVNRGGHLERLARARFARATLLPLADNHAVPEAVRAGRADAAVTDSAEARVWLTPDLISVGVFSRDQKAYLLPADPGPLARRIGEWMMSREADGWLRAERRRWLGDEGPSDPAAAGREAVAAFIRLRLDLMPDVAAAKRAAEMPLEDAAQEERVLERARAQVPSNPGRAAALYSELFDLAKAVQHRAPAAKRDAPPLTALRAALERIDAALCLELEHLLPSPAAAWRAGLRATLGPEVGAAAIDRLAGLLAETEIHR